MGTNHGKHSIVDRFRREESGDAVVEAAILFPIMTLIFAALVLLAAYLPAQAALQKATQFTAVALATEISDTWLSFSSDEMTLYWETDKGKLANVYAKLFERNGAYVSAEGEKITERMESRSISSRAGELEVTSRLNNRLVYKEVVIAASRTYDMPINLSLIGFPRTLKVTASSTAVVQNGDEFVRNMDIAADFAQFIVERLGLSDMTEAIGSFGSKVKDLLGW